MEYLDLIYIKDVKHWLPTFGLIWKGFEYALCIPIASLFNKVQQKV